LKKHDRTPLLPAALQGISKYAHLVNIDFFKDLMEVLKRLISPELEEADAVDETSGPDDSRDIRQHLLCIATAFELLSGQGSC
jgi:nucleolar complex protein 3